MPELGDNLVAQALAAVIRDHGWRVAAEPARLRAGLSDVLGASADEHKGLVDALVVSADEGTPAALAVAGREEAATIRATQVGKLEDWGLSPDRAAWVVDTWVGLVPDQTETPPETMTPPATMPDSERDASVTVVPGGRLSLASPEETRLPRPGPSAPDLTRLPDAEAADVPRDLTALPTPAPPVPPSAASGAGGSEGRSRKWILVGAAALVVLAGSGVAVAMSGGGDDDEANDPSSQQTSSSTASPTSTGTPLEAGTVVSAPDARPERASERFAMAGPDGGVRISALGPVDSVGTGDATRVAPDGTSLLAFTLADWCPTTDCQPWRRIGPRVAVGSQIRELPPGGETFAIAVPAGEDAELVLRAGGHDQRLSLLDGSPGQENITVLSRVLADGKVGKPVDTVASTAPYSFDYGFGQLTSVTRHVVVDSARLGFFDGALTPSNPHRALLYVEAYYDFSAYNDDSRYQFARDEVHLRSGDGPPVSPVADPYANEAKTAVVYVFEVPGDFTNGTFVVGGQDLPRTTPTATAGVPAGTRYQLDEAVVGIPIKVR